MIYTEPLSAEKIIEQIEKKNTLGVTNNILIVGCSTCANISCSYYQGGIEPAMSILLKPIAMEKEIEKISSALKRKYKSVDSITIMGLCGVSGGHQRKIGSKAQNADTVIVMSCPGGLKAVEGYVDDKKLIVGMQVKGFKAPKVKLTVKGVFVE